MPFEFYFCVNVSFVWNFYYYYAFSKLCRFWEKKFYINLCFLIFSLSNLYSFAIKTNPRKLIQFVYIENKIEKRLRNQFVCMLSKLDKISWHYIIIRQSINIIQRSTNTINKIYGGITINKRSLHCNCMPLYIETPIELHDRIYLLGLWPKIDTSNELLTSSHHPSPKVVVVYPFYPYDHHPYDCPQSSNVCSRMKRMEGWKDGRTMSETFPVDSV